jgi:hypothetical protein
VVAQSSELNSYDAASNFPVVLRRLFRPHQCNLLPGNKQTSFMSAPASLSIGMAVSGPQIAEGDFARPEPQSTAPSLLPCHHIRSQTEIDKIPAVLPLHLVTAKIIPEQ